MKALVKSRAQPGLWLEEVPSPEPGINDVLIRVLMTGICGTDLHIYEWDAWAQATIPVPLVIGHEFVGEIVAVGSNVARLPSRRHRQRRGPRRLRALPQLSGGAAPSLRAHEGRGREPSGRICRIHRAADEQHLAAQIAGRSGNRGHLRSLRKRGPYRPVLPGAGRGRADYRGWADRHHGGGGRAPRGRASRGDHRRESEAAERWRKELGVTLGHQSRSETPVADVQKQLGMLEGFDVGTGDVGQPDRLSRNARQHEPWRQRSRCSAFRRRRWPSIGTR